MQNKRIKNILNNNRGFSLLEVLLGITIFMIGMLGVTALNISSLKSSTFAGNMSEAVIIAGDKLEELMALGFSDPACPRANPECNSDWPLSDKDKDGTNQDGDDDGLDDDHPDDTDAGPKDDKPNFGLDDTGADADHPVPAEELESLNIGKNGMYDVYWNVAVGEPLPDKTKTVNVIVQWDIKGNTRSVNMSTIILDHD